MRQFCSFVILLFSPACLLSQSDWTQENWELRCLQGLAKQSQMYDAFDARFTLKEGGLRNGGETRSDCLVKIQSPNYMMFEKSLVQSRNSHKSEFLKLTGTRACGRNPSYAYAVKKNASVDYLLDVLSTDSPPEERLSAEIDGLSAMPLYSHMFNGVRLSFLIENKHLHVQKIQSTVVDNSPVCELQFTIDSDAPLIDGLRKRRAGKTTGTLRLMPNHDWAIHSADYQFIGKDRTDPNKTYTNGVKIANAYQESGKQFLLNKTETIVDLGAGPDVIKSAEDIVFIFKKHETIDFTLSRYGLPEPVSTLPVPAISTVASRTVIILIASGVMAAISIVLYSVSKSQKSR